VEGRRTVYVPRNDAVIQVHLMFLAVHTVEMWDAGSRCFEALIKGVLIYECTVIAAYYLSKGGIFVHDRMNS